MKIRLAGASQSNLIKLSVVPFQAFARGANGEIYFCPDNSWVTQDGYGGFKRVDSFETYVTQLPPGTEIILTSE